MGLQDRIKEGGEPIGVIGSPNDTDEFTVDILEGSITSPLQGQVLGFAHEEGYDRKLVLGQITGLTGSNPWHQKEVLKSVIKKKGALEHLSGDADIKTANLKKLGVFELNDGGEFKTTTLNTPPASGTEIYETSDSIIRDIVDSMQGIFYLGKIYGSKTVAPFKLKHFGSAPGGFGEAHRIGIFGKSGTGKSVIGATMLGGFAHNDEMGILLLDPQGQFGDDRFGGTNFNFSFKKLINTTRGEYINNDITDIALRNRGTFASLLSDMNFFYDLGYKGGQQRKDAKKYFEEWMGRESINPADLDLEDAVKKLATLSNRIYSDGREEKIKDTFDDNSGLFSYRYNTIQELFTESSGRASVDSLIDRVLVDREMVVLNLDFDPEEDLNATMVDGTAMRDTILYGILKRLQYRYRSKFRGESGDSSNALIVLDEAHNYLPNSKPNNEIVQKIKSKISSAQLTSRKYGIGWMFINQRTANFDRQVYSQLEDHVYCSGLDVGTDKELVNDIVGSEMFNEYQKLPNPKQSDIYSYMINGSIVSLGTTGRPLIVEGFDGLHDIFVNNNLEAQD